MSEIRSIPQPQIALPSERPFVPVAEIAGRIAAAVALLAREGLDFFVVYGDRERAGDLHFLTGIDPRFEEGVLILARDGGRTLLLGNENMACAPDPALGIALTLFQELSPQGQLRNRPVPIEDLFRAAGIGPGTRVGVVGGKYFSPGYVALPARSFGVPAYLVDALRAVAGPEAVVNAQTLFVAPNGGLRTVNSAHQIAEYDYAGAVTSLSVHAATAALAVGARADAVAARLFDGGLQQSTHIMVNFGAKVARGLSSPTPQVAALGDAFQIAQGLKGSLTCRSGVIAHGPGDLPGATADFYEALTRNYFDVLVAWYGALKVGTTAGAVYAAADAARDAALFDFALNPGHTLHFEEWLDSPFVPGGTVPLVSGMALQADIIPVAHGPCLGVNIEDGLVLADAALRQEIATLYPAVFERMQQRRAYVRDVIGADLDDSVLPLSNTPLWHAPYALDLGRALTA